MSDAARPAFYAMAPGGWRDYWTLLHPPYTLWHLSYVAIGAATVAAPIDVGLLGLTLGAFFLAVGIAAHALDELNGRPLATRIPRGVLISLALVGLAGALAIGIYGCTLVSWWGLPFLVVGGFAIPAYNLEWFGGRFHTTFVFAAMWGAFPALVGGFAQTGTIGVPLLLVSAGCGAIAAAQRILSTPVRDLRRRVTAVEGSITMRDGTVKSLDDSALRAAPEAALRVMWIAMIALAVGMVAARWP
jgi:hypothetical protein